MRFTGLSIVTAIHSLMSGDHPGVQGLPVNRRPGQTLGLKPSEGDTEIATNVTFQTEPSGVVDC